MREADKQRGMTNAIGATNNTNAEALQAKLTPAYTSLMDTGYFSPQEEGAATTSEMGAAAAPFGAAKFDANNTAAATHNASDLTANQDQLALEEGRTAGDAAANLQDQKMKNQEAGAYGLSELNKGDQQSMDAMYGLGPATLQAGNAATGNVTGVIGKGLEAGGTIGAAMLGKG